MDTTLDGLLNRRVMLEQPADGYRVAVDTVFLAAAVPARAGDRVLDAGCGAGGAMLCLTCRVPEISVTGIEIQNDLAELCRRNIARNTFQAEMKIVRGDMTQLPDDFDNAFDHVLMNPPYHDEARHDVSPQAEKRTANTEKEGDLPRWIAGAAKMLKPGSMLTLIHRADRMEEIYELIAEFFGDIEALLLLPKMDVPPRRVIIRGRKGGQPSVRQHKSFILHQADGRYTDEAESILRHVKMLDFTE